MGVGKVPWGEACLAMLAMLIVLVFVLIYYCVMPIYHALKRRKQREEEITWENDPRWNGDTFRYVPKMPANFKDDKKYSKLAACSRSSSMRENPTTTVTTTNETPVKPPNYADLFGNSGNSSLASTPPRYSSKTPSVEISSSNEMVAPAAAPKEAKKGKIIKPKKNVKKQESVEEKKAAEDNATATTTTNNNKDEKSGDNKN